MTDLSTLAPSVSWQSVLWRSPYARMGLFLFLSIAAICFIGPLFLEQSHDETRLTLGATPPSVEYPFGTDTLGRDLLIRTLIGGQISIFVGFLATAVALCIGISYGMIAGYVGKKN